MAGWIEATLKVTVIRDFVGDDLHGNGSDMDLEQPAGVLKAEVSAHQEGTLQASAPAQSNELLLKGRAHAIVNYDRNQAEQYRHAQHAQDQEGDAQKGQSVRAKKNLCNC